MLPSITVNGVGNDSNDIVTTKPTTLVPTCDTSNNGHVVNNKKVSRKKKLEQEREHLLEQKLLTARRQASKVRTTQELVQELALRSTHQTQQHQTTLKSNKIANETKTELMNRFFESQQNNNNNSSSVLSPPLSEPPSPNKDQLEAGHSQDQGQASQGRQSVEDVLAQLPPIDVASVLAEINSEILEQVDDEAAEDDHIEGLIPVKKEELSEGVKTPMVEELHRGQHESVNGNFNHDGAFREWHQVVSKETLNGDLLYILPYSVID